jgi:hypothetical protein
MTQGIPAWVSVCQLRGAAWLELATAGLLLCGRQGFGDWERLADARRGGRSWWAHHEFTRINIKPTILKKKIEDIRQPGAFMFPVGEPAREPPARGQVGPVELWRGW